jgi:hypothetical protein
MPSLLSGSKVLQGTTGSNAIFISLPSAQPYLGRTPSTGTGFTLVSGGPKGELIFTSTLGSILFNNGIISSNVRNGNLSIVPNGTGTVTITGNIFGNLVGSIVSSTTGLFVSLTANSSTFENLVATTSTIQDLTVTRTISFTSVTNTTTFRSDVIIQKNLSVDGQLTVAGNVLLETNTGSISIKTIETGTVVISSYNTGSIDNMAIGQTVPSNARFIELTATNLTAETFFINTATFNKVRVLSTDSDSVLVAGGVAITGTVIIESSLTVNNEVTVTNSLFAGSVYDSGTRVISRIEVGDGIGINTSTGPTVLITNTGVLSIIAGTDTAISTSTGNVEIWSTSTLQSVTDRGNETTNSIIILNTSSSTSTTTGALIVNGGVGISENLNATQIFEDTKRVLTEINIITDEGLAGGGTISYATTLTVNLTNTGVLENIAGAGISVNTNTGHVTITNTGVLSLTAGTGTSVNTSTGDVIVWSTASLQTVTDVGAKTTHAISILNTESSTASTNGALIVSGGVGVGKNVNVGGNVYSLGGSPYYDQLLYTPTTYVGPAAPSAPRIGDFWINDTIGVEYQYVPTSDNYKVWVQFIGF